MKACASWTAASMLAAGSEVTIPPEQRADKSSGKLGVLPERSEVIALLVAALGAEQVLSGLAGGLGVVGMGGADALSLIAQVLDLGKSQQQRLAGLPGS